ncbi:MAG: hypothetical protein Q8R63_10260 [Ramlibacter sp.]|nr:hypothetical protein [Ramlibacter sp.]
MKTEPFHVWVTAQVVWSQFFRDASGYILRFPDLADFHLTRDGRSVECFPVCGTSEASVQHLYLNQILPLAWSAQGRLVLHGSAVEIGDQAVAFIGQSGAGKSTLAASFATSGFRFLTDDGILLEAMGEACEVMPSHPSIRLWADSQEALIGHTMQAAPAVQFSSKARFFAGSGVSFCDEPRPLRRVYFLGTGSEPTFTRVSPSEALIELVKNSFLLGCDEPEMLAMHFDALSRLANLPIHTRLTYPRHYETLPQVRDAIVRQIGQS